MHDLRNDVLLRKQCIFFQTSKESGQPYVFPLHLHKELLKKWIDSNGKILGSTIFKRISDAIRK